MQVISSILDISAEEWDSVAKTSSKAPDMQRQRGSGHRGEREPSSAAKTTQAQPSEACEAQPSEVCEGEKEVPYEINPFTLHAFLSALEESGSAVPDAGWLPKHLIVRSV